LAITIDKAIESGMAAYRAAGIDKPLWPERFCGTEPDKAWAFLKELRTWNEAESRVQAFPHEPYLEYECRRWVECRNSGELWVNEKCRRMVVSWMVRGLELWCMGQARCDVMIAGETYTSAAKHVWRLEHYYLDLQAQDRDRPIEQKWNLPKSSHISFEGERQLASFGLPNKSTCIAVNGQSKALQGEGTAIITMEEAGTYRYLGAMLAQANIITQSSATGQKGFVNMVTNANPNPQWQAIKKALTAGAAKLTEKLTGVEEWFTRGSGCYIKLHHYADPLKDSNWLAKVKHEMRMTPRDYRREILMDDTVHDGDPVFPSYRAALHEFTGANKLGLTEESVLYAGWDCGTSRMPSFVLASRTKVSKQIRFLLEVVPDRPMAMETFAPIVRTSLKAFLPGRWSEVIHVGDATVKTKGGNVEKSAQDIAKEYGFNIRPVDNNIDAREQAVEWMLGDWCDQTGGKPRVVYSVDGCPVLVEGMRGAYCTTTTAGSDDEGPGMIVVKAAKNFFSHVNDAHQYIAVVIRREMMGGGKVTRRKRI